MLVVQALAVGRAMVQCWAAMVADSAEVSWVTAAVPARGGAPVVTAQVAKVLVVTGREERGPMRREATDPGRTALPHVGGDVGRLAIWQAGPGAQPSQRCAEVWRGDPPAVHGET